MLLSPVAVRGGDADGNRIGKELGMESVGVYDIAQVKLSVNVPILEMPQLDVGLEDALRERCGLVIMEDRDGSFLRSRAVKSCVSREERTIYIRQGLSVGARDVELMKCYARYAVEKSVENEEDKGDAGNQEGTERWENGKRQMNAENTEDPVRNEGAEGCVDVKEIRDVAVHGVIGEYRDMAGDYLVYVLCKYFHLPEYPLRMVPANCLGRQPKGKGIFCVGCQH